MDTKNDKKEQKVLKLKKVRAVAVNPMAWEMIVSYITDMPIAFGNARRAAEVQELLNKVQLVDIEIPDEELEKKEK